MTNEDFSDGAVCLKCGNHTGNEPGPDHWEVYCLICYRDLESKTKSLFDVIKHGDEKHQTWLKESIEKHFNKDLQA